MMISSIFNWNNVHVMNAFVYNVCIHDADTNSPKENLQPPLPIPYLKIYPLVVSKIIRSAKTSYLIIVFVY